MPRITPVIHVEGIHQLRRNLDVAVEAHVDGVFLINHDIHATDLATLFENIRPDYADLWIGLNFLGMSPHWAGALSSAADGLWMDKVPPQRLEVSIPVFGGVGFKYQHSYLTLEEEVQRALSRVDVLVTSGPATGQAAEPKKVQSIKEMAPHKPLGLASGLTPENVRDYLPWVDWLLVATGVSQDFTNLCPIKLRDFTQAARGR